MTPYDSNLGLVHFRTGTPDEIIHRDDSSRSDLLMLRTLVALTEILIIIKSAAVAA